MNNINTDSVARVNCICLRYHIAFGKCNLLGTISLIPEQKPQTLLFNNRKTAIAIFSSISLETISFGSWSFQIVCNNEFNPIKTDTHCARIVAWWLWSVAVPAASLAPLTGTRP